MENATLLFFKGYRDLRKKSIVFFSGDLAAGGGAGSARKSALYRSSGLKQRIEPMCHVQLC